VAVPNMKLSGKHRGWAAVAALAVDEKSVMAEAAAVATHVRSRMILSRGVLSHKVGNGGSDPADASFELTVLLLLSVELHHECVSLHRHR